MATMTMEMRQSPTPPPLTLDTTKFNSGPIPNKHIPYCSPGPAPASQRQGPATPPATPPTKHQAIQTLSILHPASSYTKIHEPPPIYSIDASILAKAIAHQAAQELPDPKQVFPWLHGLHRDNQIQLAFFIARRKSVRHTPKCLRGITIVKAGGDLTESRLKGAISADECLNSHSKDNPTFLEVDPKDGFSVRNFQIQAAKMALVSDIVIYRGEDVTDDDLYGIAKSISKAQRSHLERRVIAEEDLSEFHTFVINSQFSEFEEHYRELVAIDSQGQSTGEVMDFFQWERREMCEMSKASEISANVWLGPTPDSSLCHAETQESAFDVLIEASDIAPTPEPDILQHIGELSSPAPQHLEFPSSGSIIPPVISSSDPDPITEMCKWIHSIANAGTDQASPEDEIDADGDIPMKNLSTRPRKVLLHCADGYTETTLLGMAYYMYAEGVPLHDAWLRLHCEKQRNFFAYPSDVALLSSLQSRLLAASPRFQFNKSRLALKEPAWLSRIDGSLPSRILPYMYLGNLGHANNPDLLKALGIGKVLSVGEPVNWSKAQLDKWGTENLLYIDRVQDNGVDPLTDQFERCLDFIAKGKQLGKATLVHCRVGVSRSATICIAEVMSSLQLSFPRAYCYVRARRLNVIIQPHLRFAYELLKWDEVLQQRRGEPLRRELEWPTIAREIAAMNRPYSR